MTVRILNLLFFLLVTSISTPLFAEKPQVVADPYACKKLDAIEAYQAGFDLQAANHTSKALKNYKKCLSIEPKCVACQYEIGWSYWKRAEWEKVIYHWDFVLRMAPKHKEVNTFLPTAKENLKVVNGKGTTTDFRRGVALLTKSSPKNEKVELTFVRRLQAYNRKTKSAFDKFDLDIDSPKSVIFTPDGKKVFINSLERAATVAYDPVGLEKLATVIHKFTLQDAGLFDTKLPYGLSFPKARNGNIFSGKPVEASLSHNGKYLWVSYYRRSWDTHSRYPSGIAVIDTDDFKIKRVMTTGRIPKYVRTSPSGKLIAISNWGDNTISLIDISSPNYRNFRHHHQLVVGRKYPSSLMFGNRDKNCGHCIRGLDFSKDDRYLLVSRMKGGAISIFDLFNKNTPHFVGTVKGVCANTRDLHIIKNQQVLMTCNSIGYVAKVSLADMVASLKVSKDRTITLSRSRHMVEKVFVGMGSRSLTISKNQDYAFVAVNQTSEIVAIDIANMSVLTRIPVDSYPVGLRLSPDETLLWSTSQGRGGKGGDSVSIFAVRYRDREDISQHFDE